MPFPFTLADLTILACGAGLLQLLGLSLRWLTRSPAPAESVRQVVSLAPEPRAAERERSRLAA